MNTFRTTIPSKHKVANATGRHIVLLMLALLASLAPGRVSADDGTYVDKSYNYQVMLNGSNTIRIQVPVFDEEGADCWVYDGNLFVKWTDDNKVEHEELLFHWNWDTDSEDDEDDHDNDRDYLTCNFWTHVDGDIEVTQGNSSSRFTLTKANGTMSRTIYENSDGKTYTIYATWRLPYNLLGKTLKMRWQVKRDGTSRYDEEVSGLNSSEITVPAAQNVVAPQVTSPSLSYSEKGMIEIPWFIASTDIQKAIYKYRTDKGEEVCVNLPQNQNSSKIYLDATVPHNQFQVVIDYKDNNGYLIKGVSSTSEDLKMLHVPVVFTATPLGDRKAKVQLQWSIEYPGTTDLVETDFFEIQRSLTGEEADFTTIGTTTFVLDPNHLTYTYTDSTLVDAINEGQLKGNGTLDKLTYRVRRMMTQTWGWDGNPAAQQASCVVDDLHLLRVASYTAQWADSLAYTVRVNWDYADEYNAVWDKRAALKLRVVSTNREGAVVDSMEYTLTADERNDRYKIVNLTRPCVDYQIEVYVDRGTSPIHLYNEIEPYYFPIRTEADWNAFRQKVADSQGLYDVNARLYADISVSKGVGVYRGCFDGNGHTLTMVEEQGATSYLAPFEQVKDATIRNLRTTGSLASSEKNVSGLVGWVHENGNVLIENCRSSAGIKSFVDGDATNGGFIAIADYGSSVTIRNSLFDGRFDGAKCHSNGGFVGWSNGKVTIEYCIFAPTYLKTMSDDCDTWVRLNPNGATLTIKNSYAEKEYSGYLIIYDDSGWDVFSKAVEAAKGQLDVNVILDADITVTRPIGTSTAPYLGTFDGGGHTITANINTNEWAAAPFAFVGNATIRNLHVAGSVNGGIHSSGLIGTRTGSPNINIERVWVSTNVTSKSTHVAGVLGHAGSANVYVSDTRVDSHLLANGPDNTFAGTIIGWGGEGGWFMHRVYDHTSTDFNYVHWYFFCIDSSIQDDRHWTSWGGNNASTLTVSHNSWDNVQYYNKSDQNEVLSLMNSEKTGSWHLVDGQAIPVITPTESWQLSSDDLLISFGDKWKKLDNDSIVPNCLSFEYPKAINEHPAQPTFYHTSIGKIDKTLMTQTRQSSVLLTWETDGNPIDYFTVLRRLKGTTEWTTIATDIDQMGYEDTSVSPLEDYEYMVRATNDCEGLSYSETDIAQGACKHSCKLEGYVRFNDGTGVAGIQIEIAPASEDDREQAGNTVTVTTDESGYFMAEDLSYLGHQSVTYNLSPVSRGSIKLENSQMAVTFNSHSNYQQVGQFTITNGLLFNAYVMYDGTSIPVKGAHFKVNGGMVHNAKDGCVETDFEGNAHFYVLGNVTNTIQVVMDGHTFTGKGYYKSESGVYLNDKVAQAYFYDSTLVKLTGRVVGGKDQGSLPLDNNLSKNNLGDNLTMVIGLEGDNKSWLVYDNQNPQMSKRKVTFQHPGGNGHKTTAEVERKRMIVKPDSLTGEFVLMLPPVRWKVMQVYCEGYSTLFQDGMVSEVVDLTECLIPDTVTHEGTFIDVDKNTVYHPVETYNARYNRIYHAPVEITYRQIGYDTFDYFGDRSYQAQTIGGSKTNVPLAYQRTDSTTAYTFGYPVFSLNRSYPIQLAVVERYPKNNNPSTAEVDIVRVGNGKVIIHNGLKNGLHQEIVQLDSLGQGVFYLEAEQTTRLLTGEDALRTVTMTLEQDGTNYEAEPLRGYVLNMFATGAGKDVLVNGQPQLIDILRDPPGGGSSATLSKGSRLKYTYVLDMNLKAGLQLTWVTGTSLENYQGVVAAPEGAGSTYGIINSSDTNTALTFEYAFQMEGHRAFSYTMDINQDITTSSDPMMVGANADLYIGMVQNIVVTPMSTIRAIPDSQYKLMLGRLGGGVMPTGDTQQFGSLVHIAEGRDEQGNIFHLVRDESLGYGPEVQSQFIHSQRHILTQLIPEKVREVRAMIFTGTAEEAQAQANATGKPVYRSLVQPDDVNFGMLNMSADTIVYYTADMPEIEGMNYVIHLPAGINRSWKDEVAEKCQIIVAWMNMIAENEREKLMATEYVTNYDLDGGTSLSYSEHFESEYTQTNYYYLPGIITDYYFDNSYGDMLLAGSAMVGLPIVVDIVKGLWDKLSTSPSADGATGDGKNGLFSTKVAFSGTTFQFNILPVLDYNCKGTSGETKTFSRKERFNISINKYSHLNFDLLRTQTDPTMIDSKSLLDVFINRNFYDGVEYVENYLSRNLDLENMRYARGFVYRTRGGATCDPWEDERRTLLYKTGSLLDERTKKIVNPKISFDRQSVSGVAIGEPARFTMYLTNDSEMPEAVTGSLTMNTLYLDQASNPYGAKVFIDGSPLNYNGLSFALVPGSVMEKTIEIYAGRAFDYEGLLFEIASSSDYAHTVERAKIDVHFLREAGPVNIASPGDKWVMNTEAQYNEKRGWFMPVTIDGFDKYQHNFDHIEFQYKESQRGEEYWTNLCSYYADSTLMAQASGAREMIPENGNIRTEFYGEGTVIEKAYDLRAVLYCRDGNSFLTHSSKILSGVKDTRRPQLFGTPEPVSGIVGIGENIIFNFSEDIEHNYLDQKTNFEVKGEVSNQNVTEAVSIQFNGNSSVETEAQRNFSGKDVTIDLMIKPDRTGVEMPLFSHGMNGKKLQLWLTAENKLKAVVDEQTFTSDSAINTNGFTQVALVIDNGQNLMEGGQLRFYNGGEEIGSFELGESYSGTGPLIFGRTNEANRSMSQFYKGRIMEARVWYRALTGALVGSAYGGRRLTGYEMGLVDYYPMNEGSGDYALDHTQGANAKLVNANWAMPRGLSLHVDKADKGLALTERALNRTNEQDYTLMFWFKTDAEGRGVLLSNGAGQGSDIGAKDQFCIAFEDEILRYRSNGQVYDLGDDFSDNQWHHYAMTVNRSHNLVNIYLDNTLRATFASDSLGGISGGYPRIGAAVYEEAQADGQVAVIDTQEWLQGNVDELCLFGQALPLTLIKSYATKSPNGDEAGLLTYLSFDRQERQQDNDIELVAYPYSKRIYLDDLGNISYELDPVTKEPTTTPVRDYLFVDSIEVIQRHIDDTGAAPVVPYAELTNLNFSFVGKDNQVFIKVQEPISRINRKNIYVTLREVEDKNGNPMASPATACYYVNSSELQWQMNRYSEVMAARYEDCFIYLTVKNTGAKSHTFTIDNCPKWLELTSYSDVIEPQSSVSIVGTVNKGLNVGAYDEVIYLTDEDGVSDPLYLNLTVQADKPLWAWYVDSDLLQYSMNIVGKVLINDEIDIDSRDIVGVFGRDNVCHGFANIEHSTLTGESNLFMTVYDNETSGRDLFFKLWQYSTGRELLLSTPYDIQFQNLAVLGTDTPVFFTGGNKYIQTFCLNAGWNWISFNVASEQLFDLNNLLDGLPWEEGDVLTDLNSDMTLVYRNGHWLSTENVSDYHISPTKAYAVKVQRYIEFPLAGNIIKHEDQRTVHLKPGWNGIGYTPMLNLPVETALSYYYDEAQPGDVIKSQNEFAYFTVVGGVGRWRGSLEYMRPGEGYMLLRKANTETSFLYPFYEPNSIFIDEWSYNDSRMSAPAKRSTMSVSARPEGIEVYEGDKLLAFNDGEVVGECLTPSPSLSGEGSIYYLSIAGDDTTGIEFAIERNGEIIALTSEVMTFSPDAVIGSPDKPVAIQFTKTGTGNGHWFTTSGVQLPERPKNKGVYIYNGKKLMIK